MFTAHLTFKYYSYLCVIYIHFILIMKKFLLIFSLFLAIIFCGSSVNAQNKTHQIRVACVGNSITYGYGIADREHKSYPADLGRLLGEGYDVHNFGISARTMLLDGDLPYMKEKIYQEALDFNPNIVIIKLGTNDTKPQNWIHNQHFKKDMVSMIESFKKLSSKPRIILCSPVTVIKTHWGINDSTVVKGVIPYVKEVVKKEQVEYLDLHTPTKGKKGEYTDDGVHPNEIGALHIAKIIYKKIGHGK